MTEISKKELFKEFEEIFNSDLRICDEVDFKSDLFRGFHKEVSNIQLKNNVPRDVLINFETAKNTILYSFFCYRLSVPATLFVLATLEMALEYKAKSAGHNFKSHDGLEKKFKFAFHKKFLDIRKLAPETAIVKDWLHYTHKCYIPYYCHLRNELAHGSILLEGPGHSIDQLFDIARIINSLFE